MPNGFWLNWSKPGRIRDKELAAFGAATEIDLSPGLAGCAALLEKAILHRGKRMLIEPRALAEDGPVRVVVPEAWRSAI